MSLSAQKKSQLINQLLTRGVEEIIEKPHLEKLLKSNKKLRVKFGIDPTAPDLHLGHAVILRKLHQFQKLGHKVVLIIGDFTAQIGDPSGRSEARSLLSEKEVGQNMKKYLEQAGKVIEIEKSEIHYNSSWHKRGLKNFLEILKVGTVQQMIKREDFKKRLEAGNEISLLEVIYPLLQGYDSVAVKADVEVGGTDQKFNLLMGRQIQRFFRMKEQDIITTPLIEGTDGKRKMSKSYENYIALNENPKEMFGKIMSIPDHLIQKYFITLTDIDPPKKPPRDQKLILAETIVKTYHSQKDAKEAKEYFIKTFVKKEIPTKIPHLKIKKGGITLLELVTKAGVESKSQARRLISQKGIKINGEIKKNPKENLNIKTGDVLQIGKKRFFNLQR